MGKINSRTKGSKNERNLAKLLEKWTNKKFARTPSSGGLQWKNSMAKGDIVCTTEGHYFPFCLEAKSHKEMNFLHILTDNKNVKFLTFWEQCQRDAKSCNKLPLLFMRFNGMKKDLHFVAGDDRLLSLIIDAQKTSEEFHDFVSLKHGDLKLVLVRSDEFFDKLNYKTIKKTIKTWKQAR